MKYADTSTYHDPFGHYYLVFPSSWDVSSEKTIARCGDRTGNAECTVISTGLFAQEKDEYLNRGMGIGITMSIIDSPFLANWFCKAFGSRQTNRSFTGVRAYYREHTMTYTMNTSHAHFQINVIVPPEYQRGGFESGHNVHVPLLPIPRGQFEIVQSIIQTFIPTPSENLKCDTKVIDTM